MSHTQKISDQRKVISDVAFELALLGDAFAKTGNLVMAKRLSAFSDTLDGASEQIGVLVLQDIQERYHGAQENSALLLKAVLAGSQLAKKD